MMTKAASRKLDEVTAIDGPGLNRSEVLAAAEIQRKNDPNRKRVPIIAGRHIESAAAEIRGRA